MARKLGPKNTAADPKDLEPDSFVGQLPSAEQVTRHSRALIELDGKLAELRGKKGAAIKAGETDYNIHRGALALAVRLARFDESRRQEFLRHFDGYRAALGLDAQPDLFDLPLEGPAR